jgi:hypothetical protein
VLAAQASRDGECRTLSGEVCVAVGSDSDGSDSGHSDASDDDVSDDLSDSNSDSDGGLPQCLLACDALLLAPLYTIGDVESALLTGALCPVVSALFRTGCVDTCQGSPDEAEVLPILQACELGTLTLSSAGRPGLSRRGVPYAERGGVCCSGLRLGRQ